MTTYAGDETCAEPDATHTRVPSRWREPGKSTLLPLPTSRCGCSARGFDVTTRACST